jgi:ArsR family transcriptional regulator
MTKGHPVLALAKALADENRYKLLSLIAQRDEISCAELNERLPLAQPTISHHLKILLDAGLIAVRREGQRAYFRFNRGRLLQGLGECARELTGRPSGRRGAGKREPKGE